MEIIALIIGFVIVLGLVYWIGFLIYQAFRWILIGALLGAVLAGAWADVGGAVIGALAGGLVQMVCVGIYDSAEQQRAVARMESREKEKRDKALRVKRVMENNDWRFD